MFGVSTVYTIQCCFSPSTRTGAFWIVTGIKTVSTGSLQTEQCSKSRFTEEVNGARIDVALGISRGYADPDEHQNLSVL